MYKERKWLREIRAVSGKTQDQVAKEAGVARAYYTRIEGGQFKLPIDTAKKIAAVLGFPWEKFYEEKSDEKPA